MLNHQHELVLSKYLELYDILIPEDHILKRIASLVDFSFVIEEIQDSYSKSMGRTAEDPIQMFKYLMLKDMNEMSDRDLIERTRTDMAFKYFLGLAPEETNLIHPTTLTKFRRLRLKNEDLLDRLIEKTVMIAIENGIDMGSTLIVDATHTRARYHHYSMEEILLDRAKKLRKEVYRIDESYKKYFPKKLQNPGLAEVIEYCEKVAEAVENEPTLKIRNNIKERLNYLREGINDTETAQAEFRDSEAQIGHKAEDDPFFGYKTHIGIAENRIITAATITSGEKPDGPELKTLIGKSKYNGMKLTEIIGDTAYSGKDNLKYAEDHEIKIISKLNPIISSGARKKEDDFAFNKDANRFVCPAGHLATRVERTGQKNINKNQKMTYYFDIKKCKDCSKKEGCYKGTKKKTYSVTIKSAQHEHQKSFEETHYFKERYRIRYMIEAKNSELKNQHGYGVAHSSGLFGMRVQGAVSIFTVNIKRILTILGDQ